MFILILALSEIRIWQPNNNCIIIYFNLYSFEGDQCSPKVRPQATPYMAYAYSQPSLKL